MPPQQGDGLLDVIDGAGDFGTHGGDIRRSIWKVKLFQWCTRFATLAGGP
jgi:hypothetical protein